MRCYKEKLTDFTQCETSHWVPLHCVFFLRGMVCMNVCDRKLVMSSPQTCPEFSHGNAASLCYRQHWAQVKSYRYSVLARELPFKQHWSVWQLSLGTEINAQGFTSGASRFQHQQSSQNQPLSHTHEAQTQKCAHLSHQFWYLFCEFFQIGK